MEHSSATRQLHEQRARGIRTAVVIAAVLAVLAYLPLTSDLFLFSIPDSFAHDVAFDMRAPQSPPDIVIIAVDDESLLPKHLGRFPWPRDAYVQLLERTSGAAVVGFDILFSEPDTHNPEADARFAAAIREHGRVVLAAYKRLHAELDSSGGRAEAAGMTAYAPPDTGIGMLRRVQALNFTPPTAELARAAAGVGYVDIDPDADGVHRRVEPLRAGYDGSIYPHFSTEIARIAARAGPEQVVAELARNRLPMAGRSLALGENGAMLINYCGPTGTVNSYPFWKVVGGEVPPREFDGKIVLVGATAPGLYDIRPSPYRSTNRFFLGVETNANIVNSLLHMPPLTDASRALLWLALAVCLGGLSGWVVWSMGEVVGPVLGLVILAVVAAPSFFVVFQLANTVIPYGALVLATALPAALGIYERLGAERRMVRRQFASYVSPEVLGMLMREPELVRQGTRREVTLLFSDVRDSTSLTEAAIPEEWLAQLNQYMSQMTEAIFAYDGYLDKFMGDGIMAIWNAFGTQSDHAVHAVRAGLEMLERLEQLNRQWEQESNRVPFRIGIGLHTGEAMLGDAGSDERRQYTAIGDVVNTAARLEAMNKELGTAFIISQTTAAAVAGRFELREIGQMQVRGRSSGIGVFEVLTKTPQDGD